MHDLLNEGFVVSGAATATGSNGPVDFNSTGDKMMIRRPYPFAVKRWGIITIALMDPDSDGFEIDLDKRPTVGSDTNRVDAYGGKIIRADADTVAAGTVVYVNASSAENKSTGIDGSTVQSAPTGPSLFNPGEEAVFEVTNAVGAASTGYIWAEIIEYPFNAGVGRVVLDT